MLLKKKINFYSILLVILGILFPSKLLLSQTTITPASGACLNNSSYTTLPNIVISETLPTDFADGLGQTYILTAPANFSFNNLIIPSVTSTGGGSILITSILITPTDLIFSYNLTGTATLPTDKFIISGIQIKPTSPSSIGNILRTGGTAVQVGNYPVNTLNHGTVSSKPTPPGYK